MWTRRVRPAGDRGCWTPPIYAEVPDIPYGADIGFVVLVEIIVGGYLDPLTLLAADGATYGCHRLVDHPQAIRTPELPICEAGGEEEALVDDPEVSDNSTIAYRGVTSLILAVARHRAIVILPASATSHCHT